jgi:hypothetical protein
MATQLSGEQKAAILLKAIGEDAAASVMKNLDPKEIRRLGSFMNNGCLLLAAELRGHRYMRLTSWSSTIA